MNFQLKYLNFASFKNKDNGNERFVKNPKQTFVIAEIGVNHNNDISMAKKLIEKAKFAGADAVKFQTFKAKNLVLPGTRK